MNGRLRKRTNVQRYRPVSPVLVASPAAHLSVAVADTAPPHADVFDTVVIL